MKLIPLSVLACALLAMPAPAVQDEEAPPRQVPEETPEKPQEQVFSGPQKGEELAPLPVVGVYDELDGKELDFVANAGEKPLFLIFAHKLTRPSMALARVLTRYAADLPKDEEGRERLATCLVWLQDDRSAAREYLQKARKSLALPVPVGISVDGGEGPGSYGLNRNVILTVLVAKEGKVTANFALVQPGDRDAVPILTEVARVLGEQPPTEEDLEQYRSARGMRGPMAKPDAKLREEVTLLQGAALNPEQVEQIAKRIDAYVGTDAAKRRELGTLARAIAGRPDFETTGTAPARERIRGWAKEHAPRERGGGGR